MIELAPLLEKDGFSDNYRQLKRTFFDKSTQTVKDKHRPYAKPSPGKIREHLVRCIWFDQRLGGDSIELDDGRRVSVISQGRWNLTGGPDFSHAKIDIDGETHKGDIEIHTYASDWYKHNHNQNPAYNNTVLHVVMFNDRSITSVKRFDGSDLPQLTMSRFLEKPLAELESIMDISDYPLSSDASIGLCRKSLDEAKSETEWTAAFLDLAGDWRMLEKASRFETLLKVNTPEESLYRGIMEAMGYPVNKGAFRRLASLVSWEMLQRRILRPGGKVSLISGQTILLGAAGLLPLLTAVGDASTRKYASALIAEWEDAPQALRESAMDKSEWRFAGTRPQNYPYRRIAAVSALCAALGEKDLFVEVLRLLSDSTVGPARARKSVEDTFCLADETAAGFSEGRYWLSRNIFGGKKSGSPRRLFSANTVGIIAVNILIPFYLAFARKTGDRGLERNLHEFYRAHPKLPPTSVTRFMRCRIFGSESHAALVNNARRQQALYQIFRDYCEHDDTHCETCAFLRAIKTQD